jgi:hypothetical protein
MTYKIREFNGSYSIQKDNMSIPRAADNREYRQFIEDIALGNDTVEGPDIVSESYVQLRSNEYPSMQEQLDMQYWDAVNGTTTWKDAIDAVKAEYPKTIERVVTIGEVPAWVQEEADAFLFAKQLREYTEAVTRLAQYQLADGREEVKEMHDSIEQLVDSDGMPVVNSDGTPVYTQIEVVVQSAIDPLVATVNETTFATDGTSVTAEVPNPLIVNDDAERTAAQEVINNTNQAVIDHYEANQ